MRPSILRLLSFAAVFELNHPTLLYQAGPWIPSNMGKGSYSKSRKKYKSRTHDKHRKRYHHIRSKSRRINLRKKRGLKRF